MLKSHFSQINKLEEELKASSAQNKTLEQQLIDVTNKQRAEELQNTVQQLQIEAEKLRSELSTVKEQKKNASDELDLSLLQIAQLQEELEHYYLKFTEQQGVNHTLSTSLTMSGFSDNSIRLMRELIYQA